MAEKQAKDFVRAGYEVVPAVNGGFTVVLRHDEGRDGPSRYRTLEDAASFTSSAELLQWLSVGHLEYHRERASRIAKEAA